MPEPSVSLPGRDPLWSWTGSILTGTTLGLLPVPGVAWLGGAVLLLLAARRWPWLLWLAVVALAAWWLGYRVAHESRVGLQAYLTPQAQLVEVLGEVEGPVSLAQAQGGPFAAMAYEPAVTYFVLRVEGIVVDDAWVATTGRLLTKVGQVEHELEDGMRLRARGWMAPFEPPLNPGDRDMRAVYAHRGIHGRLTMRSRGNWTVLGESLASPGSWRQRASERAASSLGVGLAHHEKERALLDAVLLGRWSRHLREVSQDMKATGLAHFLSISGAHLGMLMGLTWMVLRLITGNPPRAAVWAIGVLAAYLFIVPTNVPIVRSGIMAGLFLIPWAMGRQVTGLKSLAVAAILVLIWRPMDLFTAGFQLSFGVVLALLLFTQRVYEAMVPAAWVEPELPQSGVGAWNLLAKYTSSGVVAYVAALPLVAYHFQLISPLGMPLTLLVLPAITLMMGLGYLKLLLGLVLPSAGMLLAEPTALAARIVLVISGESAQWPGASLPLREGPTLTWTLGACAWGVAFFAGKFAQRRVAMVASLMLLSVWLMVVDPPAWWERRQARSPDAPALRVHMLAVGDGSCFLVQSGGQTMMFDCGSAQRLEVGRRSVVPTLVKLGVTRIDTLVFSHADLDHFSGGVDVLDAVRVGRVMMPLPMLRLGARGADGEAAGDRATEMLLTLLTERGVEPEPFAAGWTTTLGAAKVEALWPDAHSSFKRHNDHSAVLRITAGGRRLLLTGDVQSQAITHLLSTGVDVRADIAELPHHGAFIDESPRWLRAVSPSIVLQSCDRERLDPLRDDWPPHLEPLGITRLVTAQRGMVSVWVEQDGRMRWSGHLDADPAQARSVPGSLRGEETQRDDP